MIVNSSSTPSSSWDQEKAFAEDMNGTNGNSVGGCVWPPRSYSCAFCLREFRSAQALGGHMNIHRRDRARLNQNILFPQNPNINAFDHQYNPNSIKPVSVSTQENNNNNYYSCPSSHDKITPPTPSYFPSSLPYYCYSSSRVSFHDQDDRRCLSTGVSMDSETKTNNYWPKRPELLFLLNPLQSPANNTIHEVKAPVASMDDHHLHLDLELRLGHANVL